MLRRYSFFHPALFVLALRRHIRGLRSPPRSPLSQQLLKELKGGHKVRVLLSLKSLQPDADTSPTNTVLAPLNITHTRTRCYYPTDALQPPVRLMLFRGCISRCITHKSSPAHNISRRPNNRPHAYSCCFSSTRIKHAAANHTRTSRISCLRAGSLSR